MNHTIAQLIAQHGTPLSERRCRCCDRPLFFVGTFDPDETDNYHDIYGFFACVRCDTNADSRYEANLQAA